jgi:hypothetical protein
MADKDVLDEAFEQFSISQEGDDHNRQAAKEDIAFARLGEQWPDKIREDRVRESRPMLTINRMPSFARQVVNDARLNKPTISVRPATGGANVLTANLFDGLIRQIQNQSSAGIAYDTGMESAVYGGFGYWRVDVDYAYNDSFDLDIMILPVENALSVYGDTLAGGADSRDWNFAFLIDDMPRTTFERLYPGSDISDFDTNDSKMVGWITEKTVRVGEWWKREPVKKIIVKLSNNQVIDQTVYLANKPVWDVQNVTVTGERETKSHKVTHRLMTATDVLETNPWKGCYIPIIPVYGDVINEEGKRHYRSLIRDAKDPQRMFNFWRTAATELVALAPRVPYIGARGSFNTDAEKWANVNRHSYSHIEYDPVPGMPPPQRQQLDGGVAAGALQEAMNASDDMKSVMGLFDASLGAKSNETSGRAIMARQREGDVSTFHFIDNRDRAIEHTGRILVDLIPHIYTGERVVTVLSEDLKESQVPLNQEIPIGPNPNNPAETISHVFDLTAGKYSLVMKKGLSYTSKREEAAAQMIEFAKVTGSGQLFGDVIAKNMDWPGADIIEQRILASLPPQITGKGPTQKEQEMEAILKQMQAALEQLQQGIAMKDQEIAQLKADKEVALRELDVKEKEINVKEKEVLVKDKQADNQLIAAVKEEEDSANEAASGGGKNTDAALSMLQNQIGQIMQAVSQPKRKEGRAIKQPDGTWKLTAVEVPAMGSQENAA